MSYADVVASLDASLPLSPHSELAAAGLRAGYETVYELPVSEIAGGDVSAAVESVISQTVIRAIESVSDIPLLGAAVDFIFAIAQGVAEAEANAQRVQQARRRQCQEMERLDKPVPTGYGGEVYPADLLGYYLKRSSVPAGGDPKVYKAPRPPVVVPDGEGVPPAIGEALWLYGFGYMVSPRAVITMTKEEDLLLIKKAMAFGMDLPPDMALGPTELRREQFRICAENIAASRISEIGTRRESDGGASVWPIILDILLDQRSRTPPHFVEWLTQHYVVRPPGHAPWVEGPPPGSVSTAPECYLPQSRAAVDRMIESWRLTVDPFYTQDRARAEELKRSVDAEVRRVLGQLPASTLLRYRRTLRRSLTRPSPARVALLGAGALGAAAYLRPDLAASALRAVKGLLR